MKLCHAGHTVLMVEEHDQIGRPFQCAGLVNPGAMKKVGLESTALTRIWGARIYGPGGTLVEIGTPERTRTWSVCRNCSTRHCCTSNIGRQLYHLNSKPTKTSISEDSISTTILTDGEELTVKSKVLLGCDGAHSWVRRYHRMGRVRETMIGFQIDVTGYQHKEGKLDMYTGHKIAPGFFAWAIPTGTTTRIGTFSRPDPGDPVKKL